MGTVSCLTHRPTHGHLWASLRCETGLLDFARLIGGAVDGIYGAHICLAGCSSRAIVSARSN